MGHRTFLAILAIFLTQCVCPGPNCVSQDRLSSSSSPVDEGFIVLQDKSLARWRPEDLPIALYVHPSGAMWFFHLEKAVRVWNERLGFQAFVLIDGLHEEAEAFLTSGPGVAPVFGFKPSENDHNPYTSYYALPGGRMVGAPVFFPNNIVMATMPEAYLFAVHELGHVLGLTHDGEGKRPWSIMEPSLAVPLQSGPPPITDHDVKLLREWYLDESNNVVTSDADETPPIPAITTVPSKKK